MCRFAIRDLLWLTVVVALGVGWWVDRASSAKQRAELREVAGQFIEERRLMDAELNALLRERDSVTEQDIQKQWYLHLTGQTKIDPVAQGKEPSIEVGRPVTEMVAALRERKIEWRDEGFAEARVPGSPPKSDTADIVFDLSDEMLARIYYSQSQRVVTEVSIIVRPQDAGRKYHSTFRANRIQLESDGNFSVRFSPRPKSTQQSAEASR